MPRTGLDRKQFWNDKILTWESERYEQQGPPASFMERFAKEFGGVNERLEIAKRIMLPNVRGKRVVELGCGSGLLAESLIEAGAASVHGIDIAETAIKHAQERIKAKGISDKVSFAAGEVGHQQRFDADFVFSLGLLDWLTWEEVENIFRASNGGDFLHSFSENQKSIWVPIHKIYVYIKYARKNKNYVIRYDDAEELRRLAAKHTDKKLSIYRNKRMRFGAFITTLPV